MIKNKKYNDIIEELFKEDKKKIRIPKNRVVSKSSVVKIQDIVITPRKHFFCSMSASEIEHYMRETRLKIDNINSNK